MHDVAAVNSVWTTNPSEPSRAAMAGPGFAAALTHARSAHELPQAAPTVTRVGAVPTVTLGEMVRLSAVSAAAAPLAAPAAPGPGASAAAAYAPLSGTGAGANPTTGWLSPVDGRISSRFGPRVHPITGRRKMHNGIDIAAPTGTPIRAVAAGTVTFAGRQGGYGNIVIVRHADGSETRYAHQHSIGVRAGEVVSAGAQLGTVGSTGASTGPHLHLELRRNGQPLDPQFLVS